MNQLYFGTFFIIFRVSLFMLLCSIGGKRQMQKHLAHGGKTDYHLAHGGKTDYHLAHGGNTDNHRWFFFWIRNPNWDILNWAWHSSAPS